MFFTLGGILFHFVSKTCLKIFYFYVFNYIFTQYFVQSDINQIYFFLLYLIS